MLTFHMTVWRDACATELPLLANEVPPHGLGHLEIQQENHHISSTNLTQHGMGISRYFLTCPDIAMVECQNGHLRGSFRCLVFFNSASFAEICRIAIRTGPTTSCRAPQMCCLSIWNPFIPSKGF